MKRQIPFIALIALISLAVASPAFAQARLRKGSRRKNRKRSMVPIPRNSPQCDANARRLHNPPPKGEHNPQCLAAFPIR